MRVALDATGLAGPVDSFARTVRALARGLAAAGHEPMLAADDPSALDLDAVPGVGVRTSELPPDTVCFWSPHIDLPAGIDLPIVATIHDVQPLLDDGRAALARFLRRRRFRARARRCARTASLVATVSEFSRSSIEQHVPALTGRARVIGQSLDPALRRPAPEEIERRHRDMGVSTGGVVCVCALRRHKNPEGLVAAYGRLPASLRDAHPLVFAGPDARGKPRVIDAARRAGLRPDDVVFLGRRTDAEIRALYAGAAVFAYPSLLEGFGLPPVEAMACGTPVVSSDRTALREVLGDAALLVDPTDARVFTEALERVLTDAALADDLRARGRARAALYDDDALGAKASAVVEEIRASGPGG